ncbi:MAG: DUF2797 domain-containing protein [Thermoplasmata archaeon]|nr:DUF2797 domain-containing protein [Thermoplasmata archaeon]
MEELHFVDFFWEDFTPHLLFHPVKIIDGKLTHPAGENVIYDIVPGVGDLWNYTVSKERWCVGRLGEEYHPCPLKSVVKSFHQCPVCRKAVGKPPVSEVFNPDNECRDEFCDEPHVVYLAFYGEKMKVGMTPGRRLLKRAVEQGADAVGVLLNLDNRPEARQEEKRISREFHIPEALSARDILRALTRGLDRGVVEGRYKRILEALGEQDREVIFLDRYPLRKLSSTPSLWRMRKIIGEVVGIKGRYLMINMAGPKAINLKNLLGRVLKPTSENIQLHF